MWVALITTMLPLGPATAAQDPEPGISQELAAARRELISDVRYELDFTLAVGAEEVEGSGIVYFSLPEETPAPERLVLDFAGHDLSEMRVNGVPVGEIREVNGHVVLAGDNLNPGRNQVAASFRSRIAPTGTPLTVYRDATREEEFYYTLVVPADAHRLFPCFDQPDLKAVFSLCLSVPQNWVAVANGAERIPPEDRPDGTRRYEFADTEPISTYLMAFATGPFAVLDDGATSPIRMRIFVRQSELDRLEPARLFDLHGSSLTWLEQYFEYDFPFGKLDVVLAPGFPYGGMEHAGAIFYRESALVFDHSPTESELVRRSTLIYHEVTHQWFGNLVTFVWFDDLWLKEGFATFFGYQLLEALEPERNAWLRFHQSVKPGAYRVDATAGTTPIYQELGNLADAKSAYGAIVYNKAPAVLRELHERIGANAFRDGVRLFLAENAFGNARWQVLVDALQRASGLDLTRWSDRWILAPGMPRVRGRWTADERDHLQSLELVQQSVQGGDGTWPLNLDMLWISAWGDESTLSIQLDTPAQSFLDRLPAGTAAPHGVLLNPGDVAYGQFLLDPVSQDYWVERLVGDASDIPPLQRAVVLSALFDTVREAEMDPRRYAALVATLLIEESDPLTQTSLLSTLGTTLNRYLQPDDRAGMTELLVESLLAKLETGAPGLELQTFRFLTGISASDDVLALCDALLAGEKPVPGLELGARDRYRALATLVAAGRGEDRAKKMTGEATPTGSEKHAFVAMAARADAATKKAYFATYLQPDEPPEQWMQESLEYFHWRDQEELTLPYLRPALDQVDWVKRTRKIFFMPAWLDAFINGHSSPEALEIVETFLAERTDLTLDVRRKILQSVDGLRRAVAIRARWQ